jgi:hypothetical protein
MDNFLNSKQIDYVLYHLGMHIDLTDAIVDRFCFNQENYVPESSVIIFNLTDAKYDKANVKFFDHIPILFPSSNEEKIFSLVESNLIFHHDLLKSAFYLLSGYHEYKLKKRDKSNRFPYELSIQKELEIIEKPIVNYYFEMIISGIEHL